MNEYVEKIVSALFENAGDSDEIRLLREEISNNCLEHFNDLCAQGMSPEAAAVEIKESLKGMEDVIAELQAAKKANAPSGALQLSPNTPPIKTADVELERLELETEGISQLSIEASDQDLEFLPSPDEKIRLRLEPDDGTVNVNALRSGDTVKLELVSANAEQSGEGFASVSFAGMHRLEDYLKRLLRSGAFFGMREGVKVTVYVPRSISALQAKTASGDIHAERVELLSAAFATVSGDIKAEFPGRMRQCALESRSGDISLCAFGDRIGISTTSGDLIFSGGAAVLEAKSVSGDIKINGEFDTCLTELRSGDAELHVNAAKVKSTSVSGDVSIAGRVHELACRSSSGDIEVSAGVEQCSLASTSGDITLKVNSSDQPEALSLNSVSGDIDLSIPEGIAARLDLSSTSGEIRNARGLGKNGFSVKAHSVSGDITVH